MKTFKRQNCPDVVTYGNRIYKLNIPASHLYIHGHNLPDGRHLLIEVMPNSLLHKLDHHGRPYQPSIFVFTAEPLYKVRKIYRKSGRRELLRKGLSLEAARRLVNAYPSSKYSMVTFFAY